MNRPSAPAAAAAAAAAYAAVTCLVGRQLIVALSTAIASDPGDPVLNAAILAWNATQVPWTDAWYQFPIFHPTPDALTLSEHLLGVSLFASPIYWLTGNAVAAYNGALLLSYPLCGIAMYALVRRLTGSAAAAFLAGLAFAFAPYRASQLPHIQVLFVFWAPLALLALHRFADERRAAWLAVFGVCWLLQGASNGYFLVFFSVLAGLWVLWFLVARGRLRDAVFVLGTMALSALPIAPVLYRYLTAQHALGLSRNLGEIASFGADIAAPLCAPATLTFWGWLRIACAPEGELFPGVALVVLCAAALWVGHEPRRHRDAEIPVTPRFRASAVRGAAVRRLVVAAAIIYVGIAASVPMFGAWRIDLGFLRASASSADKPASVALALLLVALTLSPRVHAVVRRGSGVTFYSLAALVCWVLSWGPFPRLFGEPALYYAPFAWLLQLPGVGGLRVPARFWMMTVLCLAVLLGYAAAALLRRLNPRVAPAFVGVAAAALLADGWLTIPAAPVPPPPVQASSLRGATVMTLPLGDPERDIAAVYSAVTGGWRSINGFSGYEPGYYEALRTLSRENDPVVFAPFVAHGDLEVIDGERSYRLSRRTVSSRIAVATGERVAIQALEATCGEREVGFAADGDLDTRWVCGPQTADHAITLDLGAVTPVGVLAYALGTNGADLPRHLVIETSIDRTTWAPAWEGSPAREVLFAAMAAPRETRIVLPFDPRPARYVRLRQTGRHEVNYWSIAELEVWTGSAKFEVGSAK